MSDYAIAAVHDVAMRVGESPLWHPGAQRLYWIDISARMVHRLDPLSGRQRAWRMPSEPGALARHAGGGLLVALRGGIFHLDTEHGRLTLLAAAPYDGATTRFNDGRVDAAGRFWIGTMYEPRDRQTAQMYCFERGKLRLAWSGGMTVSNGLAFSPDQRTLYHADTTAHRIERRDFDPRSGHAGPARPFRQFSKERGATYQGRPDGAAVDRNGDYWCAMMEGGCLLRLGPDGATREEVKLPLRCPTMPAFGGPDLRTLYVTSLSEKRPAAELAAWPLSGRLLALRVEVAGQAEPAYQP
jgi:sugar lactone lactonase YvrE